MLLAQFEQVAISTDEHVCAGNHERREDRRVLGITRHFKSCRTQFDYFHFLRRRAHFLDSLINRRLNLLLGDAAESPGELRSHPVELVVQLSVEHLSDSAR